VPNSTSSVLNHYVENEAVLIDGLPKPMFIAADRDDDLVQVAIYRHELERGDECDWKILDRISRPTGEHFRD
jgi:hypothetical protein